MRNLKQNMASKFWLEKMNINNLKKKTYVHIALI